MFVRIVGRRFVSAFFFFLCVCRFVSRHVVFLDFVSHQINQGPTLAKFFAPWCGHCKSMAADWETLSNQKNDFTVAEVDCVRELDEDHVFCFSSEKQLLDSS